MNLQSGPCFSAHEGYGKTLPALVQAESWAVCCKESCLVQTRWPSGAPPKQFFDSEFHDWFCSMARKRVGAGGWLLQGKSEGHRSVPAFSLGWCTELGFCKSRFCKTAGLCVSWSGGLGHGSSEDIFLVPLINTSSRESYFHHWDACFQGSV